jgi:mannose-1-phosphate guanylyltransferase
MTETWAVVLAGGEGTRLRTLTTTRHGVVIPKQYCSLERSTCLLQDALRRAGSVSLPSHVCTVVAAQHRQWWTSVVSDLNERNVFVQPQNKGTAFGILLALLNLEMRNPQAKLLLLPADHYFRDEGAITRVLRAAGNLAGADSSSIYLLGADPDCADPELGYILPSERVVDQPTSIAGFVEKPNLDFARELIASGALWNLFILVGSVKALIELFAEEQSNIVSAMRAAVQSHAAGESTSLGAFYDQLQPMDFSHDVLEVQAHRLQVIRVQHCGWTDLGTPKRVEATVRSIAVRAGVTTERHARFTPLFFNLGSCF